MAPSEPDNSVHRPTAGVVAVRQQSILRIKLHPVVATTQCQRDVVTNWPTKPRKGPDLGNVLELVKDNGRTIWRLVEPVLPLTLQINSEREVR